MLSKELLMEIVAWLAAICTTLAFLPQAIKVFKTKSVNDISVMMYLVFSFGVIMWLTYGIYLNSLQMIIANSITLILSIAILIMKFKF